MGLTGLGSSAISAEELAARFSGVFFRRLFSELHTDADQLAFMLKRGVERDRRQGRISVELRNIILASRALNEDKKLLSAVLRGLVNIKKDKLLIEILKANQNNEDPISVFTRYTRQRSRPPFITVSRGAGRYIDFIRPDLKAGEIDAYRNQEKFPYFPNDFIAAVGEVVLNALGHAVDDLRAGNISDREVLSARLESDTSLQNSIGTVEFQEVGGLISIVHEVPDRKINSYLPLLEDTLSRLMSDNLIKSMHNSAPELEILLKEYRDELFRPDAVGESIWLRGHRIQQFIDRLSLRENNPEFGPIPEEASRLLAEFVATHNLYVWCFPRVRTLIADLQEAQAGLRPFGERSTDAHYRILHDLAGRKDIFDSTAENALTLAATTEPKSPHAIEQQGVVAIVLGIARGCLQRMTKLIMSSARFTGQAALAGVIGNATYDEIKTAKLSERIERFFLDNQDLLNSLARDAPAYFGWLLYLSKLLN